MVVIVVVVVIVVIVIELLGFLVVEFVVWSFSIINSKFCSLAS